MLILISLAVPSFSSLGLGLSSYNLDVSMYTDESKELAVGRVYNVGDQLLVVSCVWRQLSGNGTLPVTLKDANRTLFPGDSFQVIVNCLSGNIGDYCGAVDIVGRSVEPVSGNPVVPGGTLNLNVSVRTRSPITNDNSLNDDSLTNMKLTIAAIGITIIFGVLISGIFVQSHMAKRRKADEVKELDSTP